MSTISRREFALGSAALALGARAQEPPWAVQDLVMDTWFWTSPEIPIGEQAALVRRAGYSGMALSWGVQHQERLAACREAGLAVPWIYTVISIDDPGGSDPTQAEGRQFGP